MRSQFTDALEHTIVRHAKPSQLFFSNCSIFAKLTEIYNRHNQFSSHVKSPKIGAFILINRPCLGVKRKSLKKIEKQLINSSKVSKKSV